MKQDKISSFIEKNINILKRCITPIKWVINKTTLATKNIARRKFHTAIMCLKFAIKNIFNRIKNSISPRELHYVVFLNEAPENVLLKHQAIISSYNHLCIDPSQTKKLADQYYNAHHSDNNTCVILSSDSKVSSKQITQLTDWTQKHQPWHLIKPIATIHFLLETNITSNANAPDRPDPLPAWVSVTKAIHKKVRRLQFHLCVLQTPHTQELRKTSNNLPSDWITGAMHPTSNMNPHTQSAVDHIYLKKKIKSLLITRQFNQLLLVTRPQDTMIYSKFICFLIQHTHKSIDTIYRLTQIINPNSTYYLALSIHYKETHASSKPPGDHSQKNLLSVAQHKLSHYRKRHHKRKTRILYQGLIGIGLVFICLYQHHYSHQSHIIRQQLNKNWLILRKNHEVTKNILSINQLYQLHQIQISANFLHLWWNNYDIKSMNLYNHLLRRVAKRSLIIPAQKIYHNKIMQLEIQMTSGDHYLSRLAQLYEALSFSFQLAHPNYIHKPYFIHKISHLTWKLQGWNQTTDNRLTRTLHLQQIAFFCHWVWDMEQSSPTIIPATPNKIIMTPIKKIRQDLLGPSWRASPMLHRLEQQRSALELISAINQPTAFLHHLTLNHFIHSSILSSEYKIAPLNDPTFYTKKLLPSIESSSSNPSLFLQAILHSSQKSKNSAEPLPKNVSRFYANQYHQQWAQFIGTWHLPLSATSSNDIHWLINLSNPDGDFSSAILYAKKQLTRSFTPEKYITNILPNALPKKITIKKIFSAKNAHIKPPGKINFEDLLATYQKHLVQLFTETQPIFTSNNSGKEALDYAQRVARPEKTPPAFLLTLSTINQLSNLIPNPQARVAFSHLLSLPLNLIWDKINSLACNHLNDLWARDIYQPYTTNIAYTYPSNSKATTDCDPDFFQIFMLTPNQGLARFLKQYIYPFLKINESAKWSVISHNGFFIHINPFSLSQLQLTTNQIQTLTSCSNKHELCLSFATHPIPNPKLDSIILNLGGWKFSYHNGPEIWSTGHLLFPQPIEYASLHLKTIYGQDLITHHSSGQYASLHLLSLAQWHCHKQTLSCSLTWTSRPPMSHRLKPSILLRGILLPVYYNFIRNGIILPKTIT